MPRQVAVISLVAGLAVVGFGVLLAFIEPPSADEPQASDAPVATLEPIGGDEPLDSTSEISGIVTSATRKPLGDVDVELVPLFEGRDVDTRDTTPDADGRFRFADVKFDLGSPYVVEAVYRGTRFSSEVLRGPRGSDPEVTLVVAPATKETTDLTVQLESVAVVGDASAVQVVHALTFENAGDKAYVGKTNLPLLRGAAGIQEGSGLDRRMLDLQHGTMISTKPILPGRTQITYTYASQMSAAGIPLRRTVSLPTERFVLLVAGELAAQDAEGLRPDGEAVLDDVGESDNTYDRSTARELEPGDEVSATIAIDKGPDLLRTLAPIGAGVIAALLLLVGILRRRRRPPEPDAEPALESQPA